MLTTAQHWLDLFGVRTDDPRWIAIEKHYSVDSRKIQLIHGSGRLHIKSAGVYVMLFKTVRGGPSPLEVWGIEFVRKGARGGVGFAGGLPEALDWNQSRAALRTRFGAPETNPHAKLFDGWMRGDRRIGVNFSKDERSIASVFVALPPGAVFEKWRQNERTSSTATNP